MKKCIYKHLLCILMLICTCMGNLALSAYGENTLRVQNVTVYAQQKTITGIVKDNDGEIVPGANVVVKGSTNGTITDLNGKFAIQANSKDVLVISFIGYKTLEISVGNQSVLNIVLSSESEALQEVVVTALGIKREKKALGYAMQEIKTSGFVENRSESVSNMLQGKVAGVQISQSATGVGGSTRVVLRGTTSLSGNNQPLWVVDGIPISDDSYQKADQWGGRDSEGGASEINPEDIESISVLKGANAAAMYGSRAQNGAIIVTTKKGQTGDLKIEYNGNIVFANVYDPFSYQRTYAQGSQGQFTASAQGAWGPYMDGKVVVENWRKTLYGDEKAESYTLSPQKNYVKDFYQTGVNYTNSLVASGGTDKLQSRFSFTDSRNQGITPNHSLNRQYYDLNSQWVGKFIDLNAKVNFMHQLGNNRPRLGEYGVMQSLVFLPRSIRLQDLKDCLIDNNVANWSGASTTIYNPYALVMPENGSKETRNRIIGKLQATAKIASYLKLTGRVGIDWYNDESTSSTSYAYTITSTGYSKGMNNQQEFNADLMLNFDKHFGAFSVLSNVGAAMTSSKYSAISGSSGYYTLVGLAALANGNNQTTSEDYSKKRVNSLLGNATIGYKSMAYLDVTARNDWSSTLPSDNRSYFYPSLSLSGIMTEMFKLPKEISYWKIRGSWAKVGNDTDPYRLANVYSLGITNGTIINATSSSTFPLSNLKPESTVSWELGTEYRMFNGRLGLDLTYYTSNTTNQILTVTTPGSSGYSSKLINAGKMKSHGWEIVLNGTPIDTKDWTWDVTMNWGQNRTKCVELDSQDGLTQFVIGETRLGKVVVNEGGRYGDIVSTAYKRDNNGNIIVNSSTGLPQTESNKVVGNMTPDWTGSFSTSLRWKNLSFNALIDVDYGGDFLCGTEAYADYYGNSSRTGDRSNATTEYPTGYKIVEGVNENGSANTTKIGLEEYFKGIGGSYGVGEEYICSKTYVKMRELSLGYTFPKAWLTKLPISSVKISAVGRDLFYIYKKAPVNPEFAFSREDYAQAFEYAALPPTRNIGFSLSIKF